MQWNALGTQSVPSDKSYTPTGVTLMWVSSAAAALGMAIGFPIAWLAARTTLPGRWLVAPAHVAGAAAVVAARVAGSGSSSRTA